MICTVAGRKMTGFIGKAVHDKRILMTMEVVSEQIIIMEKYVSNSYYSYVDRSYYITRDSGPVASKHRNL